MRIIEKDKYDEIEQEIDCSDFIEGQTVFISLNYDEYLQYRNRKRLNENRT